MLPPVRPPHPSVVVALSENTPPPVRPRPRNPGNSPPQSAPRPHPLLPPLARTRLRTYAQAQSSFHHTPRTRAPHISGDSHEPHDQHLPVPLFYPICCFLLLGDPLPGPGGQRHHLRNCD